jgi:hypothetical protein
MSATVTSSSRREYVVRCTVQQSTWKNSPNKDPCSEFQVSQMDDSGLHRQVDVPDLQPDPFSGGRVLFHQQGRSVAGSRVVRPGGRDEDARVNRGRSAGWLLSLTYFSRPTPVETRWPFTPVPQAEIWARFPGFWCPDNHPRRSCGHVLPGFCAGSTTQGGSAGTFSGDSVPGSPPRADQRAPFLGFSSNILRKTHEEKRTWGKEY